MSSIIYSTASHHVYKTSINYRSFGRCYHCDYGWFYSHSLFRPEARIRASLLKQTPLGTGKTEVRTLVEKQGWVDPSSKEQSYFRFNLSGGVSVTAIGGRLGHYCFPRSMVVSAIWEFDPSNRLVDISVIKAGDD
jgi:hypothetical protein